jgi:hypothetical protein
MTEPTILPATLHSIRRIDAREIWSHEAHQFTPWLLDHIDELNEAIGFEIELSGREEPVGSFAVDLFGTEVQTRRPAIIENQLEPTNHSHLGQLVTYAAGLKAGVIVWIAPSFREEHRQALDWLNEISGEDVNFFGVELEILEINGQRAANFKLAAKPNAWQKAQRPAASEDSTAKGGAYYQFWTDLLTKLRAARPDATTATKPQPGSWFTFSAGKTGVSMKWYFARDRRFRVQLAIQTRDAVQNLVVFDSLYEQREAIEQQAGIELEWDRDESRHEQRITAYAPLHVAISSPAAELEQVQAWTVETTARFVDAFRPRLRSLP